MELHKVELFQDTDTEALAHVASVAEVGEFDSGESLAVEREPLVELSLILAGSVTLSRGGEIVGTLGPGETIGSWALLDVEESLITATASEPVRALIIQREAFQDVIADHPELAQATLRSLARRVRKYIQPFERGIGS